MSLNLGTNYYFSFYESLTFARKETFFLKLSLPIVTFIDLSTERWVEGSQVFCVEYIISLGV